MSRLDDLRELSGEIRRHLTVSAELLAALRRVIAEDLPKIGRTTTTSLAVAGLVENYYTALETVLFRVAQNFGNNLDRERWHSDLLQRMTIAVPDVRPAVISRETFAMLDELMRFRHFKRYYFQLDFDWNRLDYLAGLLERVHPVVTSELETFDRFVGELIDTVSKADK